MTGLAVTGFIDLGLGASRLRIEIAWVGRADPALPLIVFLHEGLGSVSMWRDFPQRLCDAAGCRGLVYSRPGYGRSTPRAADQAWAPDFMQRQATDLLPALLAALGIDTRRQPPWLLGHSDGGSIALLHAAAFPGRVAGAIVMAPHIQVQALTVASIEQARRAYLQDDGPGSLRSRLARHHDDADSAFWGWNSAWLSAEFRGWNITQEIGTITCPLLAIQGQGDEYGTLEQINGIARRVPGTKLRVLDACGHSPHRDQPQAVITEIVRFIHPPPSSSGDTA